MSQTNISLNEVIKGLECCTQHGSMCGRDCNGYWGWTDGSHTGMELLGEYRTKCPYGKCETGCVKTLARDALVLLKMQKPTEARLHLCESCAKKYPECDATVDGIEFGSGVGNDNIIGCTAYMNRWKAQEPVNPIFTAMVETDMSYWSCGACGAFIFGNAYPHMLPENKPKYCGYCGRRVKWNG